MAWQEIIQFLGGSAIFAAVFGYLGKAAIDAYLKGRLDQHKSDLDRLATEHSVRFQRLHSERADIIKEMYSHLAKMDEALTSCLKSFQHVGDMPLDEKVNSLPDLYSALLSYYVPRRIFFEQAVCKDVDAILEHFRTIYYEITAYPVDPTDPTYQHNRQALLERRDFWEKARAMHSKEFSSAKRALEHAFRSTLGIGP